jgi:hypothetical protein
LLSLQRPKDGPTAQSRPSRAVAVKREPTGKPGGAPASPPLKAGTKKIVVTEVVTSVKGKFTFSCGKCHFSVPDKSHQSQPSHVAQSGPPPKPTDPSRPAPAPRSTPARLVREGTPSPAPVVVRRPQAPPPYPIESVRPRLTAAPPVLVAPRSRPAMAVIVQSPPVLPRLTLPDSVPALLRPERARADDPPPSRVAEVIAEPAPPPTPDMVGIRKELLAAPASRRADLSTAATGVEAERLLPDAILEMPALPSGLPVLPPVEEDAIAAGAVVPLIETVMQPPALPVESD